MHGQRTNRTENLDMNDIQRKKTETTGRGIENDKGREADTSKEGASQGLIKHSEETCGRREVGWKRKRGDSKFVFSVVAGIDVIDLRWNCRLSDSDWVASFFFTRDLRTQMRVDL